MLTPSVSEPKQYGSEACHAYDREGNPRHSVPYKDKKRQGEMRSTTLRDIKENQWLPSVSSILGVMAKPGLDRWVKNEMLEAAWRFDSSVEGGFPRDKDSWKTSVLEYAEEQMTRARDLGTEIHGAIERYLREVQARRESPDSIIVPGCWLDCQNAHSEHVRAAINALKELGVWGQPFESERTFASPQGYGGTIDFRSGNMIVDFKAVDRLDKKLNYQDRCAQLCGYYRGIWDLGKVDGGWDRCFLANIFISTSEPGKYLTHEWSTEEKERGWRMFCCCFELWCVVNNYDPRTIQR